MKIPFSGRVLLLGCGSVSQCFQPLALRHLEMDFSKLTVMDFEDLRDTIPETLAAGANYAAESGSRPRTCRRCSAAISAPATC